MGFHKYPDLYPEAWDVFLVGTAIIIFLLILNALWAFREKDHELIIPSAILDVIWFGLCALYWSFKHGWYYTKELYNLELAFGANLGSIGYTIVFLIILVLGIFITNGTISYIVNGTLDSSSQTPSYHVSGYTGCGGETSQPFIEGGDEVEDDN